MTNAQPDEKDSSQPVPRHGVRLEWKDIPTRVRLALEEWLGSRVAKAASQTGGFSPGVAARLLTTGGRRVFVKAAGPDPNPGVPAIYRREAQILAALPTSAPVPRLLWLYDEGEGGWVVEALEDVEGWQPALPWSEEDLDRVLRALADLSAGLTPSPVPVEIAGSASEVIKTRLCGWQMLQRESPALRSRLDAWSARHLDELGALEAEAAPGAAGNTLLHLDIRADNILLTPERTWFVDWPLACVGASWLDVLFFAPSVTLQGGPAPEQVIERHPAARAADPQAVTSAVAAIAGFFTHRSLQPPPAGIPEVRAFQAAQGVVAREWLARRTGWT